MANLPNEILDQIFGLACTDDGKTGRALSIASTRINSLSSRYKYFSIQVFALQLAKFATFLKEFEPPIQYLTLNYNPLITAPGVRESVDPWELVLMQSSLTDESMYDSSSVIFRILASKLKGLYLIHGRMFLDLDSFTFSQLDTLYIRGTVEALSIIWTHASFPSLKRLDLSCNGKPGVHPAGADHWDEMLFGQISIPTLTHFGCCAHSFDSRETLAILEFIVAWVRSKRTYPSMSQSLGLDVQHAHNFLQLEVLKLRLWESSFSRIREFEAITRRLEGWPENFPRTVVVDHKSVKGHDVPMDEWHYVVEGGESFKE